jgi:hypothetical protein
MLGMNLVVPSIVLSFILPLLRREVLDAGRHAVVIFRRGHVWREHGGLTRMLRELAPGRVFVAEPLTPVAGATGPEAEALVSALAAFDATLQSRMVPVLVFLRCRPDAAKLPANPFYMGQAMLPANVTTRRAPGAPRVVRRNLPRLAAPVAVRAGLDLLRASHRQEP